MLGIKLLCWLFRMISALLYLVSSRCMCTKEHWDKYHFTRWVHLQSCNIDTVIPLICSHLCCLEDFTTWEGWPLLMEINRLEYLYVEAGNVHQSQISSLWHPEKSEIIMKKVQPLSMDPWGWPSMKGMALMRAPPQKNVQHGGSYFWCCWGWRCIWVRRRLGLSLPNSSFYQVFTALIYWFLDNFYQNSAISPARNWGGGTFVKQNMIRS